MTYENFVQKYKDLFFVVGNNSQISPYTLLKISYVRTQGNPIFTKTNNYFAIKRGINYKNGKNTYIPAKYNTPFDSIKEFINHVKSNPKFNLLKLSTLCANPKMQYKVLKDNKLI
jgi:hypothetical protein